jgi:hypothetical protein
VQAIAIEQHLVELRALTVMPETLDESGGAAHEQGFGQAQFDNSKQDEDE